MGVGQFVVRGRLARLICGSNFLVKGQGSKSVGVQTVRLICLPICFKGRKHTRIKNKNESEFA